jgi:hypothetical protein
MFASEQEQTMYGLSDLLLQWTSERRKYGRFLAMGRAKSDQLALPVRESSDTWVGDLRPRSYLVRSDVIRCLFREEIEI